MKTLLVILLAAISMTAIAADDSVAVASVFSDVRSIKKTSYGYRIETGSRSKYAYKTSYGYRIEGGPMLYKNGTGFTVQDPQARARLTSR
jgi:hypothetical protein